MSIALITILLLLAAVVIMFISKQSLIKTNRRLRKEIAVRDEKIEALETRKRTLNRQRTRAIQTVGKQRREIKDLTERNSILKYEFDALVERSNSQISRLAWLRTQVDQLNDLLEMAITGRHPLLEERNPTNRPLRAI